MPIDPAKKGGANHFGPPKSSFAIDPAQRGANHFGLPKSFFDIDPAQERGANHFGPPKLSFAIDYRPCAIVKST